MVESFLTSAIDDMLQFSTVPLVIRHWHLHRLGSQLTGDGCHWRADPTGHLIGPTDCPSQWRRQDFCEERQSSKVGHGALTANFSDGCSSCSMTNSFVTTAVSLLIERAVSCWHLRHLMSQTTQYLDSWLSDLLQSELKWNCSKSRGHMP